MAYDELIADRMRNAFNEKNTAFEEKKMFSGLCFMVDGKMCCGVHYDKKKEMDLIMARIGEEASEKVKDRKGCNPMDFTGRPMKGYVFISPEGFDRDEDLAFWINLCIEFNPFAKASRKKRKK